VKNLIQPEPGAAGGTKKEVLECHYIIRGARRREREQDERNSLEEKSKACIVKSTNCIEVWNWVGCSGLRKLIKPISYIGHKILKGENRLSPQVVNEYNERKVLKAPSQGTRAIVRIFSYGRAKGKRGAAR